MQLVDLSKPGEKKKVIVAGVLGLVAIIFLWWTLIGFDSGTPTAQKPAPTPVAQQKPTQNAPRTSDPASLDVNTALAFTEIIYEPPSYNAPEAKRNIFAYYEPPPAPVAAAVATPTPTPIPPILLASVSPSNVYARTADFNLEAAGDKFSPDMRIFVDGRELVTSYKGPQQLSANIDATLIASPGVRQVVVRTPDNRLFSNPLTINVAAPPTPNYTFIGIISPTDRVRDTALVQDRSNRNIISVFRGDVLSGRFRVTSISEKELVLMDTNLKIKHTIAMSEGERGAGPLARPTPRVDAEDDEP